MKCTFCGQGADEYVLIHRAERNGQDMSCIPCAIKHGVYCERHRTPHSGVDGRGGKGTVCMQCVDDFVSRRANTAVKVLGRLTRGLPSVESLRMLRWAHEMENAWQMETANVVLRGVMIQAYQREGTFKKVIDTMIATQSADIILPHAF